MNKTPKRYVMIYEPNINWNKFQYIVNIGKCKLSRYNPNRFIEFDKNEPFKGITNYREYLCDIDRYVNNFNNIEELKEALGISSCYTLFYNVSGNKYYSRFTPVFKNEEIDRLLNATDKDKVLDNKIIEEMFINLTNEKSNFLDFFLKSNIYKTTVIKRSLIEYKRMTTYIKKTGLTNQELSESKEEETNIIKDELKKYPTARSVILAKYYYDQLNNKKQNIEVKTESKPKKNDDDSSQFKLPGF